MIHEVIDELRLINNTVKHDDGILKDNNKLIKKNSDRWRANESISILNEHQNLEVFFGYISKIIPVYLGIIAKELESNGCDV